MTRCEEPSPRQRSAAVDQVERLLVADDLVAGSGDCRRYPNITLGAQDHRGYKGDFPVMRQLVNQRYVYKGGLQPRFRVGE